MSYPQFDRCRVRMHPLASRENRVHIDRDRVDPQSTPDPLTGMAEARLAELAARVKRARAAQRPVVLAFGAHAIKNGLGPILIRLIEQGWVTHLATNGAAIIHDWEFAFLGQTSENVEANVAQGRFGNWEETGRILNLAINIGGAKGCGYGEAVGSLIEQGGLHIPAIAELRAKVRASLDADPEAAAAAADLAGVVERFHLPPGWMPVRHAWRDTSAQAAAFRCGVPFTGHVMIGHDIVYNHPMNHGALLGRAALRDFLSFAHSISRIDGGVYLSVGSAVMSPMIFEKSLSMAQNLALQHGRRIQDHFLFVVDLGPATWDWSAGEPPEDNPAYYQRYNKTFSRMGGTLRYLQMDNRCFLLHLLQRLETRSKA